MATQVGDVTAVSWEDDTDLAIALAEVVDQPAEWPGLGRVDLGPVRLVVVPDEQHFARFTRGRVPDWGLGLAFPQSGTIVVRSDDPSIRATLRHELAHMALHRAVKVRVPLWFDEGYAGWAAGEFDRLDAWGLNLAVIRRRVPTLDELNSSLRGSSATAGTAYALAMTAVAHLARLNPANSLDPLAESLMGGTGFEASVVATTGYPMDRFEAVWLKDVRTRYSLLTWFAAGGMWLVLAALVVVAHWQRRRRDRPRRRALDRGWDVSWSLEDPGASQGARGVTSEGHPDPNSAE